MDPVINPEALADLDDIWFYVANDSIVAADRDIDLIYEHIAHVPRTPRADTPGSF